MTPSKESRAKQKRVHVVNGLRLALKQTLAKSRFNVRVENSMGDIEKLIESVGFGCNSLLLSGRSELSSVVETLDSETTCELSQLVDREQSLPLARLVALTPRALNMGATKPAGLSFAAESNVTIIGPELSRWQQTMLGRSTRKSVVLLNSSSVEHSGPGSWPNVFRACSAVVVTSDAAQRITASSDDGSAAKTMQNMSRGAMIVILGQNSLTYCARNQTRRVTIESRLDSVEKLSRCGAAVAMGLLCGCDADQATLAAVALLADESGRSLPELVEAGRAVLNQNLVERSRAAKTARRARLMGVASTSALLLVAISTAWM